MNTDRKTIYLCLAHMSEQGLEQKCIKKAFDDNYVVPMGPNVNAFEKDLEAFVNTNNLNRKVVCLPAGPCVTDDDIRYIVSCLKEAMDV